MNLKVWFTDNNRNDLIQRWDDILNNKKLNDVSTTDKKKYYFKCPRGIHESQLFHVNYFHLGRNKNLECTKCNSFAQKIIDQYGETYLQQIWNDQNQKSPWEYGYQSKQKVLFNCIKNPGHIYSQSCDAKSQGQSCPFCANKRLSKENSLGAQIPMIQNIWSNKNNDSPYDYAPHSGKKVWWRCENGIHHDYIKKICNANINNFKCPECKKINKPSKIEDLKNKKFGELLVLDLDQMKTSKNYTYWKCECSCGNIKSINAAHLKDGSIKTCGSGVHKTGDKSPTWKGGITAETILARNNSQYDKWREAVYAKDYYTCQCCGRSKNIIKNAHHIINFSSNMELRYNVDNGITLCEECHAFKIKGSFHNIYGCKNNTPEQLKEYINNRRKELGIDEIYKLNSKIIKEAS